MVTFFLWIGNQHCTNPESWPTRWTAYKVLCLRKKQQNILQLKNTGSDLRPYVKKSCYENSIVWCNRMLRVKGWVTMIENNIYFSNLLIIFEDHPVVLSHPLSLIHPMWPSFPSPSLYSHLSPSPIVLLFPPFFVSSLEVPNLQSITLFSL